MSRPDVTIVVCTHNRAGRLPAALGSLGALDLRGRTAEILVVDNASTDETARVVAELAAWSAVPMRYVFEREQGIVPARNRGVAEARGEWIAFFDDDQLTEPDWIAELFELAERRQARCVGGGVTLNLPEGHGTPEQLSRVVRMLLGETVGMNAERRYTARVTPGCGNLMVHRRVFEEIGTFDPALANRGEDTDLWLRMLDAGIDGWFTPRAVVQHVIPAERLTDEYLLRLSRLMSEGMAADERAARGVWYPLVWLARVGQFAGLLLPRWAWARVIRDRAATLGARCRLSIASQVLLDGWRLMTTWRGVVEPQPIEEVEVQPNSGGLAGCEAGVSEGGVPGLEFGNEGMLEHASTGETT